jgi:hypothetical protein
MFTNACEIIIIQLSTLDKTDRHLILPLLLVTHNVVSNHRLHTIIVARLLLQNASELVTAKPISRGPISVRIARAPAT